VEDPHVETVTIAASREGFALSGMSLLIVSVVVAVLAVAVITGLKHFRNHRNEHRA
jgi:Tfp pilus assembly protein PilE